MARYLCSAILFLCALGANAQVRLSDSVEGSARSKVFRVDVNLVQVDVVVTDSKGRPVTDLTAEDFIVYQDGKPQAVTSFSMVRIDGAEPPAAATQPTKKSEWTVTPAAPMQTVDLRRQEVRRTIALVVDDLGLSFEGCARTREALRKWVDTKMQPGDLVAIILTGSGMGSLQQFTTDKRMLHAAIDRIWFNLSGRVGAASFATISSGESVMSQTAVDDRNMMLTEGTVGAIQYVLSGLREVPGRKSLILFSEDMRVFIGDGRDIFMQSPLQRLIDEANRATVVIHAIDPRGVVYTGPTAEDDLSGMSGEEIGALGSQRTQSLLSSQDGMVQLTQLTGGLFEHSRNDIDSALTEVVNDGEVYYLVGYQPDEATAARMQSGFRRFHSIRVQVKRKGLRVRSRSGFFGTTDVTEEPLTLREQMRNALYSPFASGDLPVRLTTLFSQYDKKNVRINALLHFDADRLDFSEEDGWQKAVVDIVATTFDSKGEQVDLAARTWTILAKGETYERMRKNGIIVLVYIPVKKPGAYQTRVVVGDTVTGLMGTATQFIEVPDVGKGNLALSGIALASERKPLETITGSQEGVVKDREVNGTPAVRLFKSGDTIMWAYQILNAKSGKGQKSQLQTYVRLFHNGKDIYTADRKDMTLEIEEKSNRMIGTGKMQLVKILPGDYALQVVVADMLAKEKYRVAAQSIHFTVQDAGRSLSEIR